MTTDDITRTLEPARRARRIYLLLCGSLAAQAVGQTAMFAVLPAIGREVGLLEIQIGAILAASSLVFFFACPGWGRVSDRLGRRPVFLLGQAGYVVGGSLFAGAFWLALEGLLLPLQAWVAMVAARMFQATLMSASQPAAGAYVADITSPATRARGLARIGAASNLGSILGPAIGGLLATVSLLAPFVFAVAIVALSTLISWRLLPAAATGQERPKPGRRVRFTDRRLRPWVVPGVLMYLGAAVVQQTLAFRMQDSLGLDAATTAGAFGGAMAASAVTGLFAQTILVQRFALAPGAWLGLGLPLIASALATMGLAQSLLMFVAANAAMGLGLGFAGAGFSAGASLSVRADEQGATAGIIAACSSAGWIVGPLLGPGLYRLAPVLPFLLTAGVLVGAILPVWIRLGRHNALRRQRARGRTDRRG
ncbi:MAG: MFS transporter [Pseudomonadales bacterium]